MQTDYNLICTKQRRTRLRRGRTDAKLRRWIFSSCRRERAALLAGLRRIGWFNAARRVFECGARAQVVRNVETDQLAVVAQYCRHRMCPICSRARGARVRKAIEELAAARKSDSSRFKLVTLTQTHRKGESLGKSLSRLLRNFTKLRRQRWIKRLFSGGIWVAEYHISDATGAWHTHLHVVADTGFLDKRRLSAAWKKSTGDSFIVHVARVRSMDHVARYVAKYLTKPIRETLCSTPLLVASVARALRGRRLFGTLGSWRGEIRQRLAVHRRQLDHLGSLREFIERAAAADVHAMIVLKLLRGERVEMIRPPIASTVG